MGESRNGGLGLPDPNSLYGLCARKATLNSANTRAQKLRESRGGRLGLPVPNSPYGLCGRKATLNSNTQHVSEPRSCVKVEVAVLGSPSLALTVYGLCGRKATLNSDWIYVRCTLLWRPCAVTGTLKSKNVLAAFLTATLNLHEVRAVKGQRVNGCPGEKTGNTRISQRLICLSCAFFLCPSLQ